MDCCCGIRLFPKRAVVATKEKELDRVSEAVDIQGDEGTNVQEDLWQLMLAEEVESMRNSADPFYEDFARDATFKSSLTFLREEYSRYGFTERLPTINRLLETIQPFAMAITTLSQTSGIVSLVWGSLQFVLQGIMRSTSLFNNAMDMLNVLSRDLPRFQAVTEVLLTPRLHEALRVVCRVYVNFCFSFIRFLRANKFYVMVKVEWSSIVQRYQRATSELNLAREEFNAEVQLANLQEQRRRHEEVVRFGGSRPAQPRLDAVVTTVTLSRNVMFSGRDEVLAKLHKLLEPSFQQYQSEGLVRRSCAVHGIGGMGKTETALEYTYRYGSNYSHIFWFHCESSAQATQSFMRFLRHLDIYDESVDREILLERGRRWFQSTVTPWLLVFDNAEFLHIIQKFWPVGPRGSIILTSQDPRMANICSDEIHLKPMTPEEGSALIQLHLRRGGSEQKAAEQLSNDLGGLPLAIAHFSGYVAKSQCTIGDINKSLQARFRSSQIWNIDCISSVIAYEHTLATVWDLAWRRLDDDSRHLLYMLSFLDADAVPEEMFVGGSENGSSGSWDYWDMHRFNESIRRLRERHLVERDRIADSGSIRTHRALQRTILHKLDVDVSHRATVFEDVVSVVRKAFPEPSIARRGDPSLFLTCQRYIAQVINLNVAFEQAAPPIDGSMTFVELLRDAGYYLMNDGLQPDAIPLLETCRRTCMELIDKGNTAARTVMADGLGTLHIYYSFMGVSSQRKARDLVIKSIELRKEQMADVPEKEWTKLDHVNHGRSFVDMSEISATLNDLEVARTYVSLAVGHYEKAGGSVEIPARYAWSNAMKLYLGVEKDPKKSREQIEQYLDLAVATLGTENNYALEIKQLVAQVAMRAGLVTESLRLHKEVFEVFMKLKGKSSHRTLTSQYLLAVCYQNTGNLDESEACLRNILENGSNGVQWRIEDLSRVKFRLSLVLSAQGKEEEGKGCRSEALETRKEWEQLLPETSLLIGDQSEMELFDFGVCISHGRTTGLWSNGTSW